MAFNKTIKDDKALTSRHLDDGRFECLVCPHKCKLRENQRGICQARIGRDGVILEAYGKISHAAIEPIEKKPIYHYKPNLKTLSVGGYGCSMNCSYCENFTVSQSNRFNSSKDMSPSDVCDIAIKKECGAVCFTYNEPIIYYEYIMDLAKDCHSRELDLVLKTNAYAEMGIWEQLCSVSSAMNIDWKGSKEQYSNFRVPNIEPIRKCIKYAVEKTHVEISIPIYYNSTIEEHEESAKFVEQFSFVPIHLLKIYPAYKDIGCQLTSDLFVHKVRNLYKNSKYVYVQNVYDKHGLQDTVCPSCGDLIASRESLITNVNKVNCCGCTIIRQ